MAPMSVSDIFISAGAILGSVGVGGATVAALSGWLGKVWANRLMEQDRAKYAADLEALKSRFEQSHRRLQAELDKTIFGHQLKTQTEFNALMEMWKKVPPLESAVRWAPVAVSLGGSAEAATRELDQLKEATVKLESLLEDFGPF